MTLPEPHGLLAAMGSIGLSILPHELEHAPPRLHPENPRRLNLVIKKLSDRMDFVRLDTRMADMETICRVHDRLFVDSLIDMTETGGGAVDPDTYITATSIVAVRRVVGTVLDAVDSAFGEGPFVSFILARPPGHHAESKRAMGFCLCNNVAVAAQYAIDVRNAERVAIVDFDVHHGNGTQEIFYDRADVLFISTHQYPFYPGTGAEGETGTGDGDGCTLNYPLAAGTGDDVMIKLFDSKIIPAITRYRPDLILISAGFDGHHLDPIGGLNLTGQAFNDIARMLSGLSREICNGRLVAVLEGGYDAEGNLDSITNFLEGLREQ